MSNVQDEEQPRIRLTKRDLIERALIAAQYEREARDRNDITSAHFWGDRYEELEDRIFDLELLGGDEEA